MGVREVKKYARKGILTVTQLAHTFRPRRNQAAAQKKQETTTSPASVGDPDKRIYVFASRKLPVRAVTIYLDVESNADDGFVYLIG